MAQQQAVSDPFALMMNPEGVFQAMEKSERLKQLKRRVCRPLDKPMIARAVPESDDSEPEIDTLAAPDDFESDFDAESVSSELGSAIGATRDPEDI